MSSIGIYANNAIIHGKSLVDTGSAVGINAVASTAGYGISYIAINNKYAMPYLSQSYRNNLYGNGGHNYTTFRQSDVFSKATIAADTLGAINTELFNQWASKGKDEK